MCACVYKGLSPHRICALWVRVRCLFDTYEHLSMEVVRRPAGWQEERAGLEACDVSTSLQDVSTLDHHDLTLNIVLSLVVSGAWTSCLGNWPDVLSVFSLRVCR